LLAGSGEGEDNAGRRCGVYSDGEEGFGAGRQAPLPHLPALLLPDRGAWVSHRVVPEFVVWVWFGAWLLG